MSKENPLDDEKLESFFPQKEEHSSFSFVLKPGMLVQTKGRSYLPETMGPFAFRVEAKDFFGVMPYSNWRPKQARFENISTNEICVVIQVFLSNVVILYREELFCIRQDFLKPLA